MNYPVKPKNVTTEITDPSKQFVIETYKVSISIIGFIVIYFLLFLSALMLAITAGYMGYLLVINHPGLVTIMIGIALCSFGFFILFFLVKFINSRNEHDISHLRQIRAFEEPELLAFIHKVADEVGADYPKKVYLSNEVNAYVFYNSSFWSLFLPVKKNLTIGLGLINSINLSEFKAILAHEFGHFSQKSMKLGSYIYYVNRVIYDMLYDNDKFEASIQKISESNGYLALAGTLTFLVVRAIQFILRLVYKPINGMYMSLSRQMEFHADAISASVSGANHLISSLHKLEVGDICFNTLISKYDSWVDEKIRPLNIYQNHTEVQKHFAKDHDLIFEHDQIKIIDFSLLTNPSRIEMEDQWASHPSTDQRADYLNRLNLNTEDLHVSPWVLFANAKKTQIEFSEVLFHSSNSLKPIDNIEFATKYYTDFNELRFPNEYHGFFDNFFPTEVELKECLNDTSGLQSILSKKKVNSLQERTNIYHDLNLIKAIQNGQIKIKTFDFDGQKYKVGKAPEVAEILEQEAHLLTEEYLTCATRIFNYFYQQALRNGGGEEFKRKYDELISHIVRYNAEMDILEQIRTEVSPIFSELIPIKQAEEINQKLKNLELELKDRIQYEINQEKLRLEDFDEFLAKKRNYFSVDTFIEGNLEILFSNINLFEEQLSSHISALKRDFLEYQLEFDDITKHS